MEKTYKRVPFDIELAKKIQSGEVEGRIITQKGAYVRLLCTDRSSHMFPVVGLIGNCDICTFTKSGVIDSNGNDEDCIFIELLEETPKHNSFTKKLHDTAEVLSTPKHEFEVGDVVTFLEGELKGCHGFIREINSNKNIVVATYSGDVLTSAKRISKGYNQKEKHELKPFDKVLVRDHDYSEWCADFYSHLGDDGRHMCVACSWNQCIPYEGNEHLVGTTNNPKEE